jgi:hypothetical protein
MLGVGAFVVMFWVGFVLGYEAGLACLMLPCGLVFGALGTQAVVSLEQHANGRRRPPPVERQPATRGGLPTLVFFHRAD